MTASDVSTKICSKCKQEKPFTEFYKACNYAGGVKSECKICFNKRNMQNYVYKNIQEKVCMGCGTKFLPNLHQQKYCTVQCRIESQSYVKKEPQKKNCVRCGVEFLQKDPRQRYCTEKCSIASYKEMNISFSKQEGLTKKCFTCGVEKPLSDYHSQNTALYGVANHCRACEKEKNLQKKYGDDRTAKCSHCGNEFNKVGEEKKYCSTKCRKASQRERDRLSGKPRKQMTPEQYAKHALYTRERRKNNPEVAIRQRIHRQIRKAATRDGVATLIWGALKRGGESKKVEEKLGYTITDLRNHLERQFTKGMSWDKFMNGEIHIDHIHPKTSFDLSDDDQWKACWSLPNLRPLWARENLEKRNKILHLI